MLHYFKSLPTDFYPVDGCARLVRDAWLQFGGVVSIPVFQDFYITGSEASELIANNAVPLRALAVPVHGCMVSCTQGKHWHCGVVCVQAGQIVVIHVANGLIKFELLSRFKARYENIEYFIHADHY